MPGSPQPGMPTPGTPNPSSPNPGTPGTPNPGTPNPGSPNPGTPGSPNPGTPGTANPGTGGTPNPGTGGTPNPGTGGTPNPGEPGSPNPPRETQSASEYGVFELNEEPDPRYVCQDVSGSEEYPADDYECSIRDDVGFCKLQWDGGAGLCSLFTTCFFPPRENMKIWCPHTCDKFLRAFPRKMCREHHRNQKFCGWWRNDEENSQVCFKKGGAYSKEEEVCKKVDKFIDADEITCEGYVTTTTPAPATRPPAPVYDKSAQLCMIADTKRFCHLQANRSLCGIFKACFFGHNVNTNVCMLYSIDEENKQVCMKQGQNTQCVTVGNFIEQEDICSLYSTVPHN